MHAYDGITENMNVMEINVWAFKKSRERNIFIACLQIVEFLYFYS